MIEKWAGIEGLFLVVRNPQGDLPIVTGQPIPTVPENKLIPLFNSNFQKKPLYFPGYQSAAGLCGFPAVSRGLNMGKKEWGL